MYCTKTNEQNEREIEMLRKRICEILHSITDPEELYKIYLLILKAVSEEARDMSNDTDEEE